MDYYVITSLENAASTQLALHDIEYLQTTGIFESLNACVLVAAKPMAAAEEFVSKLDNKVSAYIIDAKLHLSFKEHVMLALSKRNGLAASVFRAPLKKVLEREATKIFANLKQGDAGAPVGTSMNNPTSTSTSTATDIGAPVQLGASTQASAGVPIDASANAPSSNDKLIFLEAHNEYLVHVFSAAKMLTSILLHDGMLNEVFAIKQAERLLQFKSEHLKGSSIEQADLDDKARMSVFDEVIAATLGKVNARIENVNFCFSGTIKLSKNINTLAVKTLQLETAEGLVLFHKELSDEQKSAATEKSATTKEFATTKEPATKESAATKKSTTTKKPAATSNRWSFSFTLSPDIANSLPPDTKLYLRYFIGNYSGASAIRYTSRDFGKRGTGRVGRILIDKNSDTTCFLCQSDANFCQLVSRATDISDTPAVHRRIRLAWLLSKLQPVKRKIVLWEKFSSRYEESARRVYEYLVDDGNKQARFVLDGDVLDRELDTNKIKPVYQSQIVRRCSFEHYHLIFSGKTFIGTEALSHLIGMQSSSRFVRKYIKNGRFNYVFLQHGPSYTVTLGSEGMSFFNATNAKGMCRVAVSSDLEKEHFIQSGGYKPEELYICGMPKYDVNTWSADADLIAVMPTWRPWEEGTARVDFTQTSYHRFLMGIHEAVPEHLRKKLRVLVHPRFQQYALESSSPLVPYMTGDTPYDEILRQVKLLITDHSSISFDAFYRGANVIFDWEELDECMQAYGQGTHLMLTEDLAFGEVYKGEVYKGEVHKDEDKGEVHKGEVYKDEEKVEVYKGEDKGEVYKGGEKDEEKGEHHSRDTLRAMIERAYTTDQSAEHIRRYRKIINFHDGKNTDRLMGFMRADGLI